MISSRLLIALFVTGLSATSAFAAPARWADPMSATEYLLLEGKLTWTAARDQCHALGYSLFNRDYLSAEEQERLYGSELFKQLPFVTQFVGQPGERRQAHVWMSSQLTEAYFNGFSHSVSLLVINEVKRNGARLTQTRSTGAGSTLSAVCMFQKEADSWVSCTQALVCTYERPDGSTRHLRHSLGEEGVHQAEALRRIRDRAKNWLGNAGARCELSAENPYCTIHR